MNETIQTRVTVAIDAVDHAPSDLFDLFDALQEVCGRPSNAYEMVSRVANVHSVGGRKGGWKARFDMAYQAKTGDSYDIKKRVQTAAAQLGLAGAFVTTESSRVAAVVA